MQPGDIVESVDMEMSDDETDSKPKGRVLVDVRSQDRDMRVGNPSASSQHMDMDMRMIPLPAGQMPGSHGQIMQDVHMMHSGPPPPPPPPPQFHPGQPSFHQDQTDFRHNSATEFHPAQTNFHQNRPPPNFIQNQPDFGQQDFHQMQPEFPKQEFEYRENHALRPNQEFLGEPQMRGRYSQPVDHQHRDIGFHRNDRGGRGGRGFARNRRDRYSDDHKSRNIQNNRKSRTQEHQRSSPEILPNSRPLLVPAPDTVVIIDEEGMPIGLPNEKEIAANVEHSVDTEQEENCQDRRLSHGTPNSRELDQQSIYSSGSNLVHEHESEPPVAESDEQQPTMNQVTVVPVITDSKDSQHNQYVSISEYEEHVESEAMISEKTCESSGSIENAEQDINFDQSQQQQQHISDQLDDLGNSMPSNELKRPSTNGNFDENDVSSSKKRLLSNGPQTPTETDAGLNGPIPQVSAESHPGIYDFEGPNFRPRLSGPVPFPPWRGGLPRGRGFRGGPRAPWMDRGPRPVIGNFMPRGLKRGGQFRGNGFRGRGRGNNW